jgi:hypothetical protein
MLEETNQQYYVRELRAVHYSTLFVSGGTFAKRLRPRHLACPSRAEGVFAGRDLDHCLKRALSLQ